MLSDEEYNILKNSKTPDELWTIKDSLMNSDALLKYHDKKYISIQCLSSEQYNNYIINGTCDGAITKRDINTWNHANNPNVIGFYSADRAYTPADKDLTIYLKTASAISHTYTGYSENIQNNINTNAYNCLTNDFTIKGQSFYWSGYGYWCTGNLVSKTIKQSFTISKTSNSYQSETITSVGGRPYGGGNFYLYLSVLFYSCFRPAFKFIDNNKSKTIYY